MAGRIWDKFLTERDQAVFSAAGFAADMTPGKRPAVIVIDVSYGFVGEKNQPLLESIKTWPNSCGEDGWAAIPHLQRLLDAARAKGLPVIYTTGEVRPDKWDVASWGWKNVRTDDWQDNAASNRNGNEIVAEIAPQPTDVVIKKQKPSAFFGTPLASYLTMLGCDSLIVTGTSTSGCVRATVIDAFSDNYRVVVAEQGCFDRSQSSHAINLCDMNAKYANVRPMAEVVAYIEGLPDGLYPNLPTGRPK